MISLWKPEKIKKQWCREHMPFLNTTVSNIIQGSADPYSHYIIPTTGI